MRLYRKLYKYFDVPGLDPLLFSSNVLAIISLFLALDGESGESDMLSLEISFFSSEIGAVIVSVADSWPSSFESSKDSIDWDETLSNFLLLEVNYW